MQRDRGRQRAFAEPGFQSANREILTTPRSPFTASMLRDIERGARVEADHIIGDLPARAGKQADHSALMRIAYGHLKAYEARRMREAAMIEKTASPRPGI